MTDGRAISIGKEVDEDSTRDSNLGVSGSGLPSIPILLLRVLEKHWSSSTSGRIKRREKNYRSRNHERICRPYQI